MDSPISFDGQASFVGGQFSYAKAKALKPNQASLLQNAEVSITGQVSTRFGTAYVGGALGASGSKVDQVGWMDCPNKTAEVAIQNGNLYYNNGGTWTVVNTITVTEPPSMAQGVNKLYLAAGGDIYQWTGTGTTLTNLSSDAATTAPRNASILLWHLNRVVAAGPSIKSISTDTAVPDAIYFSNFLDAGTWGTDKNGQQIRVGAGDGLAIKAIVPWSRFNLAVLKRQSAWVVQADPTLAIADIPIQCVHSTVGCVARRTAVQVGDDVLFLSDDGVRSIQQVAASEDRHELSVPLSFPIQDYINRINWASASDSCATFWNNLYILVVPLDSSTTNNYCFIYHTILKSWIGFWTNLPINCFARRVVSGVLHLFAGLQTDRRVIEYLDFTNINNWVTGTFQDYDGTQIQPTLLTRAYLFNDDVALKLSMGAELEWANSSGSLVVTPILDEVAGAPITIPVSSGGVLLPNTLPFVIGSNGLARKDFDLMSYGEFRQIQFNITGTGTGRKEIRQLAMAGVLRPTLVGSS